VSAARPSESARSNRQESPDPRIYQRATSSRVSNQENPMSKLDDILQLARTLTPPEREQLLRELSGAGRGPELPLASRAAIAMSRPDVRDPVGWRKAEAGHAVLAVDTPERDEEIPTGPKAIAGIWAGRSDLTPENG